MTKWGYGRVPRESVRRAAAMLSAIRAAVSPPPTGKIRGLRPCLADSPLKGEGFKDQGQASTGMTSGISPRKKTPERSWAEPTWCMPVGVSVMRQTPPEKNPLPPEGGGRIMATMRPPGETLGLPKKTPEPPGGKAFPGPFFPNLPKKSAMISLRRRAGAR